MGDPALFVKEADTGCLILDAGYSMGLPIASPCEGLPPLSGCFAETAALRCAKGGHPARRLPGLAAVELGAGGAWRLELGVMWRHETFARVA